jgi:hypothetical protein
VSVQEHHRGYFILGGKMGFLNTDDINNKERDSTANAKKVIIVSSTGGTRENYYEVALRPFGKGLLTSNGAQYSSTVSTTGAGTWQAVETKAITLPVGSTLVEVDFGLTAALISSDSTEPANAKWQIGDSSTAFDDLCDAQTRTAPASTWVDITVSGRQNTTGGTNFTGATNPFYVRYVVNSTGVPTSGGKTKNSSYVKVIYKLG